LGSRASIIRVMSSSKFSASLLRTSASGLAALTASRLLEGSEAAEHDDFDAWRGHFQSLLLELSAAVEVDQPDDFARQVAWLRSAFEARGNAGDVVAAGLEAVAGVLEESLPPEAWQELPDFLQAAREALARPMPTSSGDETDARYDAIVDAYLEAVRSGRAREAIEPIVAEVRSGRLTIEDALDGVLTHALHRVGQRWHAGELGVAEEHFSSLILGRVIEQLVLLGAPDTKRGLTVVLSMVAGDAHDLGLRIVSALFELDGWTTVCLGSNMPHADLATWVSELAPDLLVVGATLSTQRTEVTRAVECVRALRPQQVVLVGGPAFARPGHGADRWGGDAIATTPREAVRVGRELVGASG